MYVYLIKKKGLIFMFYNIIIKYIYKGVVNESIYD